MTYCYERQTKEKDRQKKTTTFRKGLAKERCLKVSQRTIKTKREQAME